MRLIRSRLVSLGLVAQIGWLALPCTAHAGGDGLSFFHRFVAIENGQARLRSIRSAALPPANAAIVACGEVYPEASREGCVAKALVPRRVDRLEVIETAQDVIVPTRRERELGERGMHDLAGAM